MYSVKKITHTLHDEIANELEQRQQELNDRLKMLTSDNKAYGKENVTNIRLFQFISSSTPKYLQLTKISATLCS